MTNMQKIKIATRFSLLLCTLPESLQNVILVHSWWHFYTYIQSILKENHTLLLNTSVLVLHKTWLYLSQSQIKCNLSIGNCVYDVTADFAIPLAHSAHGAIFKIYLIHGEDYHILFDLMINSNVLNKASRCVQ